MPLFGKSHKNPTDIVKTLKDNLSILVKQDKKTEKVRNVTFSLFIYFTVSQYTLLQSFLLVL